MTADAFVLAADAVERVGIRDALETLYREEVRAVFRGRIDEHADAMGVNPGERWSCATNGHAGPATRHSARSASTGGW